MKKLNVLVLALLALTMGIMTSCDPEETDFAAPTVTFTTTNGAQEVDPNTEVTIIGDVLAPGGIAEIKFFKGDESYGTAVTDGFDTDTTHRFSVTIPAEQVTETFVFDVQVEDKEGQTGKKSVDITVTTAPVFEVGEFAGVGLEYTSTSLSATNMFNMETGTALAANGTAADMDLAFCWQNTALFSIVPPNSEWLAELYSYNGINYSTSDKNATKLAVSSVDYSAVTVADIDGISVSATADLQELTNGDVIEFETVDGEKGFMKVNIAKVTKNITVDVKYKATASTK